MVVQRQLGYRQFFKANWAADSCSKTIWLQTVVQSQLGYRWLIKANWATDNSSKPIGLQTIIQSKLGYRQFYKANWATDGCSKPIWLQMNVKSQFGYRWLFQANWATDDCSSCHSCCLAELVTDLISDDILVFLTFASTLWHKSFQCYCNVNLHNKPCLVSFVFFLK